MKVFLFRTSSIEPLQIITRNIKMTRFKQHLEQPCDTTRRQSLSQYMNTLYEQFILISTLETALFVFVSSNNSLPAVLYMQIPEVC